MLWCSATTASDPPICSDCQSTDAGCQAGTISAWLWQQRTSRHPSLSSAPSAIGVERGSTADLSVKTLWPHHWCSSQSTLATSARAHPVQDHGLTVLTYQVLHDSAPRYLGPLDWVADLHGRRALRSASSSRLVVPMFRLSIVCSRTFNVSEPRIWNGLPEYVVLARTFSSFRSRLKPFLFCSHILILSSNCTFDTIVVLVVINIT